jgi:hypothetical protein
LLGIKTITFLPDFLLYFRLLPGKLNGVIAEFKKDKLFSLKKGQYFPQTTNHTGYKNSYNLMVDPPVVAPHP